MKFVFIFMLLFNFGFTPDKKLSNENLEARAHALIAQLRCFVCQGQPLAQSNVRLAQDLRALVRYLIKQGKSDEEVLTFITKRYGKEVLLKPPFEAQTIFLWVFPFIFLPLLAFIFWRLFFRKAL